MPNRLQLLKFPTYSSFDSSYRILIHKHSIYVSLFLQENQNNLDQNNDKENDPKVQVDGKLVGEINPDNFTYESDFMPKVKPEIKQENHEELPLLVTNVQSLNEPSKPKEEKLPLDENDVNKPQSENAPIRLEPHKFGCPFCPKLMQTSAHMIMHIRTHTGEKPFICNDCGKSFCQKSNLAKHTLIHTGEQPFECNDCGKRFNQKSNLTQHIRVHTGEQPFSCTHCGKTFKNSQSLIKHLRNVHSK